MRHHGNPITILVADADHDERKFVQDVIAENHLRNPLHFVEDGAQFMQYLNREGDFSGLKNEPYPGVILLNPELPKLDGRNALAEIRQDPQLRAIPVIVLTASQAEQDIFGAFEIGANAFIPKPVTLAGLVQAVSTTADCWIKVIARPQNLQSDAA